MLPLEKSWYRKLLLLALIIGVFGGVTALLFMGITGRLIGFFFGNTGTGWWEGNWWWIPLTALGGLVVSLLRNYWQIPKKVPGSIALAKQAWVDPSSAIYWLAITTISLIFGASLGPSFALIVMGGSFGSWLVTRLGPSDDDEAKAEYTLTGMAGGMGAAFSAPLFAAILASELSPTSKRNYVAALFPQLFAATVGFVIFFGVTGTSILGSYELPAYEYSVSHLIAGALLGFLAVFILLLFALISKLVSAASEIISNPVVVGVIGGACVGLIAFALPFTATAGTTQLAVELQEAAATSSGLITAILIGKMFAVALSQSSGFLGGIVFPIIFIGGTAGLLVNSIFPEIPIALCVGAMLAAVPGALLNAPLSLIIIAAATVSIGFEALVPVGIAVVVAHITMSIIQSYVVKKQQLNLQAG